MKKYYHIFYNNANSKENIINLNSQICVIYFFITYNNIKKRESFIIQENSIYNNKLI